ncbi:hypothetical protein BC629DRAFT_961668 [Irpex lacteus]|nr:hypothetical protein BC629DRAFT_961668 [Irpex lacteus]
MEIIQDETPLGQDIVSVEIITEVATLEWFDLFSVCAMKRDARKSGIGIFTPAEGSSDSRDCPSFHLAITIRLPQSLNREAPLQIKSLETRLPDFNHYYMGDLLGRVKIHLRSFGGTIFAHLCDRYLLLIGNNAQCNNQRLRFIRGLSTVLIYHISSRNINGQLDLNVSILPFYSTLRIVRSTDVQASG